MTHGWRWLAHKPSKRDLAASRRILVDLDARRLNSADEFDGVADCLRVDNTDLSPHDVATRVIERFGLRECAGSGEEWNRTTHG